MQLANACSSALLQFDNVQNNAKWLRGGVVGFMFMILTTKRQWHHHPHPTTHQGEMQGVRGKLGAGPAM